MEYRQTLYDTVPPLPPNFVARPQTWKRYANSSLATAGAATWPWVRGIPGSGKTVLAQALCADEAVQAVFSGRNGLGEDREIAGGWGPGQRNARSCRRLGR